MGWLDWKRLTASVVPGKNTMVRTASAFIAELSCPLALAMTRLEVAISRLMTFAFWDLLLSLWAIKLHNLGLCCQYRLQHGLAVWVCLRGMGLTVVSKRLEPSLRSNVCCSRSLYPVAICCNRWVIEVAVWNRGLSGVVCLCNDCSARSCSKSMFAWKVQK